MADAKITIDSLPPVTLPLTGNENILVSQAGVAKVMKPGDVQAFAGNYIKQDGTLPFTGNQSMGGFQLKNIGAPIDNADATRLQDLYDQTVWKSIDW